MKKLLSGLMAGLFATVSLLLISIDSRASHIYGMDLNYQWQHDSTYQITLVAYGDCSATSHSSFITLATDSPVVCVYNGGSNIASVTLRMDTALSGINVTPVCAAFADSTQCTNTSYTTPGITKYTYIGTYTMPSRSQYWRFTFDGNMGRGTLGTPAGRTASITNIVSGTTMFLEDTLNNLTGHNTSPTLPNLPTPFYYENYSSSYNPGGGVTDAEGDSLNYTLIAGETGTGSSTCSATPGTVTYNTGYTATQPIAWTTSGSFDFNNRDGQIDFTTDLQQRSTIIYNIDEYRGGAKVGTSQREMTFVVASDLYPQTPPGIDSTTIVNGVVTDTSIFSTCAGSGPFSFEVKPIATDTTWDITVTWAALPSGASIVTTGTATHPIVTFSWNTAGAAAGTYPIYITYTYAGCPISQSKTATYTVNILALPAVSPISGPDSVCVGTTMTLTDTATIGNWSSLSTSIATVSTSGVVTGVGAGEDSVYYTVTNTCGTATASYGVLVKPGTSAGTIEGSTNICVGTSSTYTDSVSGGTWSVSGPATVSLGITSGNANVLGVTDGTDTLKYTVDGFCGTVSTTKLITIISSPTAGTITGPTTVCDGDSITLSNTTTGGVWSSTFPAIATVSSGGVVYGVSGGIDTIEYTVTTSCGTAIARSVITSTALANAGTISGSTFTVCQSATITLTTSGSGGVWSSDSVRVATVSSSGVVGGAAGGTDTIVYTVTNSCGSSVASAVVTVNPLPVPDAISGAPSLCPGDTSTFSDPSSGGTWSSSNTSLATVNSSTGLVTAVSVGAVDISYSVSNTCGTVSTGEALAVNATPSAGTITGASTVCLGATTNLNDAVSGGTWSSLHTGIATISSGGVVSGAGLGVDTIEYSVVQTCGSAFTLFPITVITLPVVGSITGADSVCIGGNTILADTSTSGAWSSLYTAIATVTAAGHVGGAAAGIDTIKYTESNSCGTTISKVAVKVNPLPSAGTISGTPSACIGGTTTLVDGVSGGTWSSANAAKATVTTPGGVVYAVAVGTVKISYTVTSTSGCGSATDTMTFTINPLATVSAITGTLSICPLDTTRLSDATAGGVWSSNNTDVAIISATGLVTGGTSAGTATIYYAVTNVCNTATDSVTFTTLPNPDAGNVTGTPTVCPGTTASVADAATGGTWSSANNSIATINTSGLVTGVSTGVDTIYYTVTNSCGTASASILATVNAVPIAGAISGSDTICQGATTTFISSGTGGGTWSSSNSAVATVSAAGHVGGVSSGTATITYNVTNSCGTVATYKTITINPLPNAGTITGLSSICPTGTTTLSDAISGGTWSSTNTAVATITAGGFVSAASPGTTTISYTLTNSCGMSAATLAFTVTSTVNAGVITGSSTVCATGSITLSDTVSGGSWTASNGNATINISTGFLGGITDGADTITYTVSTSCGSASTTFVVTVGAPASAGTITGSRNVCVGSTINLSNTTTGGIWSSRSSLIASVSSSGTVGGASAGSTIISYALSSTCGTSIDTFGVTVSPAPNAGTITGGSSVCVGAAITLGDTTGSGTWTISNSNATLAGTVVTGAVAGLDTVTYSVMNACATATTTDIITINPSTTVGGITGVSSLCQGLTSTFTDPTSGGSWSTSNAAVATISSSGLFTAVSGGSVTVTYTVTTVCGTATQEFPVTVNPSPNAGTITGPTIVCIGSAINLTDTASGGTWTSGTPAVATINSSGMAGGVASGSTIIAYTVTNSCGTVVAHATVNVFPVASGGVIGGSTIFCVGGTSNLTETVSGGTWSSVTTSVATVNSSGTVFGVSAGTSLISYTVTTGCGTAFDTATVTINSVATGGTITGPSTVCIGSNISLNDPVSGGTWSSGTTSVATISAGGSVTGVSSGTSIITYTVSSSCGSAMATYTVTVSPAPSAGSISGTTTVCAGGATTSLTDAAGGGTWTSTNPSVATVNSSGLVTGVTAGSTTISYTVSTGCAIAAATASVTVNPLPVAGTISGPTSVCVSDNMTLTESSSGGNWGVTAATSSFASITSGGMVTGLSAGTAQITYSVTNSCGTATTSPYSVAVGATANAGSISGTTAFCIGGSSTLTESASGGTWSSTNTAVATVNSSGGITAISAGTTTISYTVTTACDTQAATVIVTVSATPVVGSITGSTTICLGTTANFTDGVSGGTWSSVTTSVATVTAGGMVTGVSLGTSVISYTITNTCGTVAATLPVTVSTVASAGTLSGPASICSGTPTSYSSTTPGGSWTTSNPSVATITAGGSATGLTTGSVTFTYSISSSCGSATANTSVTVVTAPSAGTISGTSPLCAGTATSFTDATSGGTWSSSNLSVATVGSSSGSVSAITPGSATITYTVTNACGSATTTFATTVDAIASGGTISGTTAFCAGTTSNLTTTGSSGGTWSSNNTAVATVNSTGTVTGVSGGSAVISYSISGACGSAFSTAAVTISAVPDTGSISGPAGVCVGSVANYTETSSSGSWSSSNTSVATVDASGHVSGVSIGSAIISYTATSGCGTASAIKPITVSTPAVVGAIGGSTSLCQGATSTLTESATTGTWSSSNSSIATVSATGLVSAAGGGTDTISYTVVTGCSTAIATSVITVTPTPAAGSISGSAVICTGTNDTLTDAATGGTWSSSNAAVATVTAGVVTGLSNGSATISYIVTNSCGSANATLPVTVSTAPSAGSITGDPNVCIGSTSTLNDGASGGVWSSSNSAVVSVSSSGVIRGVSNGSATISYSVVGTCRTAVATITANSNPFPNAGTISGPSNICVGSATTYVDTAIGGVWSSADTAIAKVNASGVVTGISVGAVNIYYSVSNACGATNVTILIHVLSSPGAGTITGSTTVCPGTSSTLSDTLSGGTWSTSDTTIAIISSSGILTGVTAGSATVSYGVTSSCGIAYTTAAITVRSSTGPGTISGFTSFCPGASSLFSATVSGGTWSSRNTSIATVNSSGTVTGVSPGTDTIAYTVTGVCGAVSAIAVVTVLPEPNPGAITGPSSICVGLTSGLGDSVSGGTWTSSNTAIATVSSSGLVTAVSLGSATISYTVSGSCGTAVTTSTVTITTTPDEGFITGTTSMCAGTTTSLTESVSGGVWSSGTPSIATVNTTGVVTGVSGGTVLISYSVSNACGTAVATAFMTVRPLPATGTISGPTMLCVGVPVSLTDTAGGSTGTWSSSNPSVATVDTAGLVTPLTTGTATISYSLSNACGTASALAMLTINGVPASAGTITGAVALCPGSTLSLSDTVSGGTWSSSNTAIATINSSGVVFAVSAGSTNISYTVTNSCGSTTTTTSITVNFGSTGGTITAATTALCIGDTVTLHDAFTGGTWRSTTSSVATISSTGLVTAETVGSSVISYTATGACGTGTTTVLINVNPSPALSPISGPTSICGGTTASLSDTVFGGTWISSNTSVATISSFGTLTGVSAGVTNITYTETNAYGCTAAVAATDTVNPAPDAGSISGATTTVCTGTSISFTDAATGGTWSSGATSVATVSSTGVVYGVASGSTIISYSVSNSCGTAMATVTVNVDPSSALSAITGVSDMCAGSTASFSDTVFGGGWSSSNTAVASVSSTGVVTGISAGVATISYSDTNAFGCVATVVMADTVHPSTSAGSITASTTTLCAGTTITLSDAASGGVWSSSDSAIATVNSSGIVSGVSAGTTNVSYTVSSAFGCSSSVSVELNINPTPYVSLITGATSMCSGSSVTLSDSTSGGTWGSSNTSVATISASGLLTSVGPGVTTASYSLTNGFSCTTTRVLNDTVSSVPTVAAISGSTSVCEGATTSLSDATSGGAWSSSSTSIATISSGGSLGGVAAGNVTITYTVGTSGCSAFVTYADTVIAAPSVGGISGTTTVCSGGSSTLTDGTSGGTWSSSNMSVATVNTSGAVTSVTAGSDTILYTVTSSTTGCRASAMAVFTVNPIPVVHSITGSGNACLGATVSLNDSTSGGSWSSSDTTFATIGASSGVVTGMSLGTATITYSVTSGGCTGMATISETVHALPVVGAISGSTTVCPGLTITLTDATSGGVWSSSNTATASVNDTTGIVSGLTSGSVTIYYTVTNSFNCSSDASTSITVTTGGAIDAITGTSSFCIGTSVTLADGSSGGTWSSSNAAVASVNSSGVVSGLSGGVATISYTISGGSGCPGIAVFMDTVESVSGTLIPASGSITLCHGLPVNVGISSTSATSYQWYKNGNVIVGATDATYNTDTVGLYSVRVSNGTCSDVISGITVSLPVTPVIHHGSGNLLYTGTYSTYQWYRDGGLIAGATGSSYTYGLIGNYVVVVTDASGCTDTSLVYVVTSTGGGGGTNGVATVNAAAINLYPNPATSVIRIDAPVKVNISILTTEGRIVITQNDASNIDVSGLANGLYMIMIYDENNVLLKADKFVKAD